MTKKQMLHLADRYNLGRDRMRLMKKLHNRRQPVGLECNILKKAPMVLLVSTLVPLMISVLARALPASEAVTYIGKYLTRIAYFSIALTITLWTALFTLTQVCIIALIMKGDRKSVV